MLSIGPHRGMEYGDTLANDNCSDADLIDFASDIGAAGDRLNDLCERVQRECEESSRWPRYPSRAAQAALAEVEAAMLRLAEAVR